MVDPLYKIARTTVAMIDRAGQGTVLVTGADRRSFLQGLLTNDLRALESGRGCYAAWLTPHGRMITDMRVIEPGGRILLEVRAADAHALAERLDQLVFAEDVQAKDVTAAFEQIRLVGPAAAKAVTDLLTSMSPGASAPSESEMIGWAEYDHAVVRAQNGELIVVRDDGLGVAGYDLYVDRPAGDDMRTALDRTGVTHLDEATVDVLRIENGRPLFGVDMHADTIPLEAGIEDRAISFSKGCYVGQEVIVRVVSRGQGRVARRLVGLSLEGRRVPASGEPIAAGGRDIGHVTSAVQSPALGRPIALGYVQRDFADPGARVAVGGEPATVTPLPFVTPVSRSGAR
jgi:tRNA-modifying protein YgfZ